jgi:5-methylcytosine-specific restriction enzyme A
MGDAGAAGVACFCWGAVMALHILRSRVRMLRPLIKARPKKAEGFYQSSEWRAFVRSIKKERGDYCQRCGSSKRVIGDHIVERKDGGADFDRGNVELLCIGCHNAKTARARALRAVGYAPAAKGGGS